VWLNVFLFFLYAGLEVGVGQWAYRGSGRTAGWSEGRGVASGVAGAWVAVYWGSLTVGRVLVGALASRVSVEILLNTSLATVPLGVIVLWRGVGPAAGAIGLAMLGLALAPVYPLLISATPARVGAAHTTRAIGFQVAAFYVGTAALPGTAGILARHAGLEVLGPFLLVTAFALGLFYALGSTREAMARAR
jgi:fucose permease